MRKLLTHPFHNNLEFVHKRIFNLIAMNVPYIESKLVKLFTKKYYYILVLSTVNAVISHLSTNANCWLYKYLLVVEKDKKKTEKSIIIIVNIILMRVNNQ